MYSISIKEELDRKFQKLSKKNKKQLDIIFKKIEEICKNPNHYKNTRHSQVRSGIL